MNQKTILATGCVLAAATVALGAFGAHGLKETLEVNQRADTFELAIRYQFYHTFGILLLGAVGRMISEKHTRLAFVLFIGGILLFSGSLLILSLTNQTKLGMITPIGGLCFIAGWLVTALGFRNSSSD